MYSYASCITVHLAKVHACEFNHVNSVSVYMHVQTSLAIAISQASLAISVKSV